MTKNLFSVRTSEILLVVIQNLEEVLRIILSTLTIEKNETFFVRKEKNRRRPSRRRKFDDPKATLD